MNKRASGATNRLFVPNVLLHHPLYTLVLRAHVLTCSNRCDSVCKCAWLIRIGNEAFSNGIGAFSFASSCELDSGHLVALSVIDGEDRQLTA
jgi:hypothetical protein